MSRPVIAAIAALVIGALTMVAYLVTTSSLESKIRNDVRRRVSNAQDLLLRDADLEALGLLKRAEALSRDPRFVLSLNAEGKPNAKLAEEVFDLFAKTLEVGQPKPNILALTDKKGMIVALHTGDKAVYNPIADTYISGGEIEYPALRLTLSKDRYLIVDIWRYEDVGPMRAATVPVIDPDESEVVGAIIVAHSISSSDAARDEKLLGADIAYFMKETVYATSFDEGRVDASGANLKEPLFASGMAKQALSSKQRVAELKSITIGGDEFIATAGRLPRFASRDWPADYPPPESGTMVAMSVTAALAPLSSVKLAILLVGLGSIVVALLVMFLAVKRVLVPLDRIENGVAEVLNGNLDYSFAPVGSDLDGLANSLNVLLARLLGRPEPGEEEYDDDGNLIRSSASMKFGTAAVSSKDAEAIKLAQESEDSYYVRLHSEYKAALEAAGESTAGLSLDSFINKLRLSEATLKEKYESRGVRFKVVTDGGKVTLKPVPIM